MKRQTIENILDFLNTKENKKLPKKWFDSVEKLKLIQELENHPDGTQYKHRGSLDLRDSTIRKLPNDLHVTGYLDLNKSKLTKLPNDLYVDGYLNLRYCQYLTELPDNLHVEGYLNLADCKQLTELPDNLYVGGDLGIYYTPIAQKYSSQEIREMITSKGGTLIGKIYR